MTQKEILNRKLLLKTQAVKILLRDKKIDEAKKQIEKILELLSYI